MAVFTVVPMTLDLLVPDPDFAVSNSILSLTCEDSKLDCFFVAFEVDFNRVLDLKLDETPW